MNDRTSWITRPASRRWVFVFLLAWVLAVATSFIVGLPQWVPLAAVGSLVLVPLAALLLTVGGRGPNPAIFRVGMWVSTVALVVATASLVTQFWTFATSSKPTPDGPLRISVQWATPAGVHTESDGDWTSPADPLAKRYVDASSAWKGRLVDTLPTGWSVDVPYGWSGGSWAYPASSAGAYAPTAAITLPEDARLAHRSALWVPTLLTQAAIVLGLWWTRRMLVRMLADGPFHPAVYRALRRIAVLGLVGGIAIAMLRSAMLNDFYAALDLGRYGVYAVRHDDGGFQPAWIFALAVVEVLRYGVELQRDQDATV